MNKLFLIVAFVTMVTTQHSFGQDSTKTIQLSTLLNAYYGVKNALVSSNATAAATKAGELVNAIDAVDIKSLSEADHKAYMNAQHKIKKDAQAIAASNKIEGQRTTFSSLSNSVYALAKTVNLSVDPVYQQYCPMKKMYWLSSESTIKNPYYGSMMLTCGKVTDTLK